MIGLDIGNINWRRKKTKTKTIVLSKQVIYQSKLYHIQTLAIVKDHHQRVQHTSIHELYIAYSHWAKFPEKGKTKQNTHKTTAKPNWIHI